MAELPWLRDRVAWAGRGQAKPIKTTSMEGSQVRNKSVFNCLVPIPQIKKKKKILRSKRSMNKEAGCKDRCVSPLKLPLHFSGFRLPPWEMGVMSQAFPPHPGGLRVYGSARVAHGTLCPGLCPCCPWLGPPHPCAISPPSSVKYHAASPASQSAATPSCCLLYKALMKCFLFVLQEMGGQEEYLILLFP